MLLTIHLTYRADNAKSRHDLQQDHNKDIRGPDDKIGRSLFETFTPCGQILP